MPGADGLYRFGPELADWVSLLVAMDIESRGGDSSRTERQLWCELFNETVRADYGRPHSLDEIECLERKVGRFIRKTAASHLQIYLLKTRRNP
jgi:hypothetical protein